MIQTGLFVGLITLDLSYLTLEYPRPNQKVVASDWGMMAGGPATNAAVTFQVFQNHPILLGSLGQHPLTDLIRSDLETQNVTLMDLTPESFQSPPVSSIVTTAGTGNRAVISINATQSQISSTVIQKFITEEDQILNQVKIILIDGHQMAASEEIAKFAQAKGVPIIIDAGSWKPGFETVLPLATAVICSANFFPPGCQTQADVFHYLLALGISKIAITHGDQPIQYWDEGQFGNLEIPPIHPVDTLGAGDIFHGAFCHFFLQESFVAALADAAQVASYSCQFFGTRRWIKDWGKM